MGKDTGQCPQTTTFLKRKESRSGIEPRSVRLPAKRLTARPNRLTKFIYRPPLIYTVPRIVSCFLFSCSPTSPSEPPYVFLLIGAFPVCLFSFIFYEPCSNLCFPGLFSLIFTSPVLIYSFLVYSAAFFRALFFFVVVFLVYSA